MDVTPLKRELFGLAPTASPQTMDEWLELIHPDDRERVRGVWLSGIATLTPGLAEYRAMLPDGSLRWLESRARPQSDASGRVTRIIGVTMDVSERKAAQEALQREHAWLEAILHALPAGVLIAEAPSGQLVAGNARVRQIWRHDFIPSASIAQYEAYRGFHPDGRPYLPDEWPLARTVTTGQAVDDEELRFRRGDGTWGWLSVSTAPIRDPEGRLIAAVAVFADITEQREMEETLRDADRRKDEFLAILSHELRNPMAPIRNALDILRLAEENPALRQSAQEILERQTAQLVRLIDQLLDVSRITRGRIALDKERVDLRAILAQATETVAPLVERKQQALRIVQPPAPVTLDADAMRLAQVFTNLLNNASKFSDTGASIDVTIARDGEMAVVRVADQGAGITPQRLPHLFEAFSQETPVRERPTSGLGVGLALARRIVELHGGSLSAFSEGPGSGSEFTVRLPLAA